MQPYLTIYTNNSTCRYYMLLFIVALYINFLSIVKHVSTFFPTSYIARCSFNLCSALLCLILTACQFLSIFLKTALVLQEYQKTEVKLFVCVHILCQ